VNGQVQQDTWGFAMSSSVQSTRNDERIRRMVRQHRRESIMMRHCRILSSCLLLLSLLACQRGAWGQEDDYTQFASALAKYSTTRQGPDDLVVPAQENNPIIESIPGDYSNMSAEYYADCGFGCPPRHYVQAEAV